jgi:phosphohistidine phosphatase
MKFITLFRHAKSSWKYPVKDLYRPLNARGLSQASEMASRCELETPDLILSSNAIRAASTALIYAEKLSFDLQKFRCIKQLYELDSVSLVNYLSQNLTEDINRLWMFGHNPTLNDICAQMLGAELDNIVTSGYVDLALDIDCWRQIKCCRTELLEANNR